MQSKEPKKSMTERTQEISKEKIANSKHLIEEKDKHLFVEVSPQTTSADKAELIGKTPIWVSNDQAAIKELCANIKAGHWLKVLDTHYYPQLATAGYLSDQLTLDEIQTVLFIYSYSVEKLNPKIEVYKDCFSFNIENQEIKLLTALKVWYEIAGGLKGTVAEDKFLREYSNLPTSQRVFFIVTSPGEGEIVHSMASLNLYFQCMPTKIPHKPLQGRLGFLSLDEIESSVRKNQRYLGLSYPGSPHFPIRMMDYGVPHDLAHIVQQLAATQETLDLAAHLIDTFRKITGVKWNMYTWGLIDNPLNFSLWHLPEEDCLGHSLKFAYTKHLLYFSLVLSDILSNPETYKKLKCNTQKIFDIVPNIEALHKILGDKDNIQVKILIVAAFCLLNKKNPGWLNIFTDIATEIRSKVDLSKVRYMRKKVDDANGLQIYNGDKQITFESVESFLDALELGYLLAPAVSQAQTQFFTPAAAQLDSQQTSTTAPSTGEPPAATP